MTDQNEKVRQEFNDTVVLFMNALVQHPGDSSRALEYAMRLVLIDRKFDPRGLPLPATDSNS